jgi:hypothetical protein
VIRSTLAVLAVAFALAHIPYIASTLEDIDSVNFALGVRDFDVADHRPHPPGYPMYIALGKIGVAVTRSFAGDASASTVEATTLSAVSLIGAVIAILLLYRVFGVLSATAAQAGGDVITAPWRYFNPTALAATALTATAPLFWYLAVRPISDVPGLAMALAAQACLGLAWWRQQPDPTGDRRLTPDRMAASGRMIVLGALLAAISVGFRSQNTLLTLPFLLGVLVDRIGRGFGGAAIGAAAALLVGAVVWAVPLVVASGGVDGYLAALGSQAGEDFAGVQMLYLNPTSPRLAAFALLRTLIYPWDSLLLGGVVIALAAAGIVALAMFDRRALVAVMLLTLPYFLFHLLFHDTTFVRYALPLVPMTVLLAVRGAELVARRAALPVIGAAALWAVSIAAPVLAAYGSEPSPVARLLETMRAERRIARPGALAMHQTFRRPLQAETVEVAPTLPSPPRREWLELAKYWREGHLEPLWFLADPRRTDVELIDPRSRSDHVDFAWSFQSLSNLGGMRPSAVNWYRIAPPGWFAGEGWALTPEIAGISELMGRGPSLAPITAWVRRRSGPVRVLVGGRHLGASAEPPVTFVMTVDGVTVAQWQSGPGFFLETFDLPPGALAGEGLAELTIRAISSQGGTVATAIEQFNLQNQDVLLWGYDEGWQEAESNPELGIWRWMSERATLRIVGATSPLLLTMRVERPRKYFDDDPIVRMTAGDELLGQTTFAAGDTWTVRIPLEALLRTNGRITVETNRTFVPAERGDAPDRRRLGLRVFRVNITSEH